MIGLGGSMWLRSNGFEVTGVQANFGTKPKRLLVRPVH